MPRLSSFRTWVAVRVGERSTVIGLIGAIVTLGGWTVAPEKIDAIATVVGLVLSAVLIATEEAP